MCFLLIFRFVGFSLGSTTGTSSEQFKPHCGKTVSNTQLAHFFTDP